MRDRPDVLVIGGGPVGVCCAHFLARAGAEVTLIERAEAVCPRTGAAYGSCELITPSAAVPLAAPGALAARATRYARQLEPPPHGSSAQLDSGTLAVAVPRLVRRSRLSLQDAGPAGAASRQRGLHDDLGRKEGENWGYRRHGLFEVCETTSGLEAAAAGVREARRVGVDVQELSPTGLRERLPGLRCGTAGGFFFPEDAHVDPMLSTCTMAELAA